MLAGRQVDVRREAEAVKWELAALQRRLADLTAEAASGAAAASKQRAVLAHARLLRGLDSLDTEGWRDFLVKLVDRIVVQPAGLELHLVLPTAQVNQRSNQESNSSSTLSRAGSGSFSRLNETISSEARFMVAVAC